MNDKKVLVVFHSSSGNTEKVAQAVAKALSADVEQIQQDKPYRVDIKGQGVGNFLNMGRAILGGMTKRATSIHEAQYAPADYDLVVVGTPVYASTLPAPTRAYLERYGAQFRAVVFFCTGDDPNNEHIFELMEAACGKSPQVVFPFHAPEIRQDTFQPQVKVFVSRLFRWSDRDPQERQEDQK